MSKKNQKIIVIGLMLVVMMIVYSYSERFDISDSVTKINAEEKKGKTKRGKIAKDYIANLSIKDKVKSVNIYDNVKEETLYSKGAGLLKEYSSDFGKPNEKYILGHRETVFNNLDLVELNDIIVIETSNKKIFKYKVFDIKVVRENNNKEIFEDTTKDVLVLDTCYPVKQISKNPTKNLIIKAVAI